MDLKSFETLIRTENSARLFLVKYCWKNERRFCPRCQGRKIYRIIGKRFRCKQCSYTFYDFTGRFINQVRIGYKNWLWIVKLFELELSAEEALFTRTSLEGMTSLMFCGYRHIKIDHQKCFASDKVYINGVEGFWSYAKERLIKFHGISKEKFPLYLKEMEFRYNNRNKSLFYPIAQNLCNFVPELL